MAWHSRSLRRPVLYTTMVSRDGLPFLGHVATATPTGIDKTSSQGIRRPGLLSFYKRVGQGPGEDNGQRTKHKIAINISSNHLVFLFPLFETWAHHPLSQACNPYTSTSVQGNTNLSLPAGRRAFFCPNQDKLPCVLLASPSRKGTHSIYSLV
jgi:hypothetical protein